MKYAFETRIYIMFISFLAVLLLGSAIVLPETPAPSPSASTVSEPPVVKGVYLTGWSAGSSVLGQTIRFINETEINALVIDIKDDTGGISYPSQVPLVRQIGSGFIKFDPKRVLALLQQHNIYPIARIVVFKDPFLAGRRNDLAVKDSRGGLWLDDVKQSWVDPYNREVWEYNVAIAKEAAALGFREIQFDYVRFTSDGQIRYCVYPGNDGRPKSDVIRDFLKYAYQELHPMGVKVSADIFGAVCSNEEDFGIGQVLEKMAEGVDLFCPMVYPSHYPKGTFEIAIPETQPFLTIHRSLTDARRRLAVLKLDHPVTIRPWLQDFSLRYPYGREQLLEQIRAVDMAGYREWLFWNPSNIYNQRKYRTEAEAKVPWPAPSLTPTPSPVPSPSNSPSPG
jgi:hypothetical protein